MNVKIHKNILLDIFIILLDIGLVILACKASEKLLLNLIGAEPLDSFTIVIYTGSLLFMFYTYDFYTKIIRNKFELLISILISVLVADIAVIIADRILMLNSISPFYYLVIPFFLLLPLGFSKLILLRAIKRIEGPEKLLIIESDKIDNSLARKVKYSYIELYDAWYIQIDTDNPEHIDDLIIDKFPQYDCFFISNAIPSKLRDYLISKAMSMDKGIYVLPGLYDIGIMNSVMVQFDDTPLLKINKLGLTKLQRIVKRAADIIVSTLALIIISPIIIICAFAIKLDSKGPVFYTQERLTRGQKPFRICKFRTMITDAERDTGATLATLDDPRITKVGKLLRSFRLDELPQFFNILSGSMSVVGPRPERPEFVSEYLVTIENYDKRFYAKAGLTGLAQVYMRYGTSAKDKTLYDILYIKDYSLWLDIKLVLLTLKTVFVKEQSGGVKPVPDYQKSTEVTKK